MKSSKFVLFCFMLILAGNSLAQNNNPYQFVNPKPSSIVNPKPASVMVSNETNIILRYSGILDQSSISSGLIKVEGSKSGIHTGDLLLSDDNRTIVFNPDQAFAGNETVNIVLLSGISTHRGVNVPEYSFSFTTAPTGIVQLHDESFGDNISLADDYYSINVNRNEIYSTLPAPPITIDSLNNPSSGYIFMATWDRNVPAKYGNFIFILDSAGTIVDSVRVKGAPYDFQVQQNGLLTYALGDFASNVPLPGRS